MKKIFIVIALILIVLVVYFAFKGTNKEQAGIQQVVGGFSIRKFEDGYPKIKGGDNELILHKGYHLSYNEKFEQPNWVAYILTRAQVRNKAAERGNNFRPDPKVSTESASPADYKKSGYDKGHIAPAADMGWSVETMSESFFMSNMSPQTPEFNRGIWKELEEQVRIWADKNDSLYVVSGPVFINNKGEIGKNQVAIPGYYYKVVMDISQPSIKAIAFYLPNGKSDKSFFDYALSVKELENKTGFDFFAKQNPKIMKQIEEKLDISQWK
jgi:endonuclease G, mitochondrial